MDDKLAELITQAARQSDLDPALVWAICKQESGMNPLAVRHEPAYKWVCKPVENKPHGCSLDTERMLQKTSFGLMQVMGAVFREYGFKGWLSEIITQPALQLEYGCKHLKRKLAKYGSEGGIVAYNSGSPRYNAQGKYVNQYYLDNVLKYAETAVATGLLPNMNK